MTKRQWLEFFLFVLVACLLSWIFCLEADYESVKGVQAKIQALDSKNALFARKIDELQDVDGQLARARNSLDKVKKWITGNSLAEMLAFCEHACQNTGLHLHSFEPGEKTDFDFYTTHIISMHLTGPFQAQRMFLQTLVLFEKLLSVEQIRLQKDQSGTALNMRLVLRVYLLNTSKSGNNNAYIHKKSS